MQDFLLRPGAGEEERHSAQRHHSDRISQKRHRHESAQAAHFPDVLLLVAAVNDRTGTEKEERLEKAMREQVHDPGRDPAYA